MYEKEQAIFAQVGDCCYLARFVDVEVNGDIIVCDVHWVSRKGSSVEAEAEFHRTLGTDAEGCELYYRGPVESCIPHGSFHSAWPHALPMGDVT